jgi:hypothetical protein
MGIAHADALLAVLPRLAGVRALAAAAVRLAFALALAVRHAHALVAAGINVSVAAVAVLRAAEAVTGVIRVPYRPGGRTPHLEDFRLAGVAWWDVTDLTASAR